MLQVNKAHQCLLMSICLNVATDLIGAEKAGLLCELLDEIGRKDLTAIVKEYMNKLDGKYRLP